MDVDLINSAAVAKPHSQSPRVLSFRQGDTKPSALNIDYSILEAAIHVGAQLTDMQCQDSRDRSKDRNENVNRYNNGISDPFPALRISQPHFILRLI
jgi:hypothetical protein